MIFNNSLFKKINIISNNWKMNETFKTILNYFYLISYLAFSLLFLWIMIIGIECLLNKYYGYKRFNFSKTYYNSNPRVSNSCNTI